MNRPRPTPARPTTTEAWVAVLEERLEQVTETLSDRIGEVKTAVLQQNGRLSTLEKLHNDEALHDAEERGAARQRASNFSAADKWLMRVVAVVGGPSAVFALIRSLT